jgi:hypothetical protein
MQSFGVAGTACAIKGVVDGGALRGVSCAGNLDIQSRGVLMRWGDGARRKRP